MGYGGNIGGFGMGNNLEGQGAYDMNRGAQQQQFGAMEYNQGQM